MDGGGVGWMVGWVIWYADSYVEDMAFVRSLTHSSLACARVSSKYIIKYSYKNVH